MTARFLHYPVALLGAYYVYRSGCYFFTVWVSLREQGIPSLYLVLGTFFASWWLMFTIMVCFLGNFALQGAVENGGVGRWLWTFISLVASSFLSWAMLVAYFFVLCFLWPWVAKLF